MFFFFNITDRRQNWKKDLYHWVTDYFLLQYSGGKKMYYKKKVLQFNNRPQMSVEQGHYPAE